MRIETPRGRVFQMTTARGGVRAELEWNPAFADTWDGHYDRAQKFVDSEVLRHSAPYLPFQTGMLRNLGILGTIPGRGEVIWNGPYARFLYYGRVMVGASGSPWARSGERKRVTARPLTFNGAPKRGAFWFERMKAEWKDVIIRGAGRIAGGGS